MNFNQAVNKDNSTIQNTACCELKLNGEHCPFCGGQMLSRFIAGNGESHGNQQVSVIECQTCVFAWQWPLRRTTVESVQHYDNRYGNAEQGGCNYFHTSNRVEAAKAQLEFVKGLPGGEKKSLLDVGAGLGFFVHEALKAGFDAIGVEPSPKGVEAGNEMLGPGRMFEGSIEDLPSDRSFDVITLWDVIEHVERPRELVRSAVTRLQPGGWLVIETGNYQSVDRLMKGPGWWAYHLEHRWYFAPSVMELLLREEGLNSITHSETLFRAGQGAKQPVPSLGRTARTIIRAPWEAGTHIREYKAWRRWKRWGHLPIFTVAGQKFDSGSKDNV
ncbi:MAG: class I SAM-dependent methyltransferase [Armatimonadetes bacterium]|nr:class I SAM-dependent methyltransferase [Armatimonadota bacterium]